jgi:LacI family transcriptional regulator
MVSIGAVRALHHLGLQHTVAIVGFDDVPLGDVLDPPITVVAQDPAAMGRLAARRILGRLDGDTAAPATTIVPARLIVRGSGEIRPASRT